MAEREVGWVIRAPLLALVWVVVSAAAAHGREATERGAGVPTGEALAQSVQLVDDPLAAPALEWASPAGPRLLDLPTLEVESLDGKKAGEPGIPGAGVSYALADSLLARVNYKHAFLFGDSSNEVLQNASFSGFSAKPDRDIVNLQMSWRLARSTVDLGYRFESARPDPRTASYAAGARRWLPGSEELLHGLMLGFTQQFGTP